MCVGRGDDVFVMMREVKDLLDGKSSKEEDRMSCQPQEVHQTCLVCLREQHNLYTYIIGCIK